VSNRDIRKTFAGRPSLDERDICRDYWPELDPDAVVELLALVEQELKISTGVLRPGDRLDELFRPATTRNPMKWLLREFRSADRKSEINWQLSKRMKRHGTPGDWATIETVDDLVRAWCGQSPRVSRR
jgi:hypothetical protein